MADAASSSSRAAQPAPGAATHATNLSPTAPNGRPDDRRHSVESTTNRPHTHASSSTTTYSGSTCDSPRLSPVASRQSRASARSAQRNHLAITPSYPDDAAAYQSDSEDEAIQEDLEEKEREKDDERIAGHGETGDVDLEKQEQAAAAAAAHPGLGMARTKSSRSRRDPTLVTWDGLDDPQNPKNWPTKKKWAATLAVSCFTFISPVSSSLVAPAIPTISKEFGVTNEISSQLMLSIFVLAYAFGPLILGPLSEIYGRVPVLQLSNLFYLAFNIACGFSQTRVQLTICRFFAGLGGSAPLAIGGGVLSDCWRAEERGKSVGIYSLAPLLGPAVGPLAGGFITQYLSWRWSFHITSIADAVIQVAGFFVLRETYPAKLLRQKAKRLRKETGDTKLRTEYDTPQKSAWQVLRTSCYRPFVMLGTQPIIQVLALYMAYIYGLMYLVLASFPSLWTNQYHESISIGGLNYISIGIGFFIGSQTGSRVADLIYCRLRDRSADKQAKPEFRLPLLFASAVLLPIGLFIYGWTADKKTHWIGPNIGAAIIAAGIIPGFQGTQTYLIDAFLRYAASAIAAGTFLRSLAGFGFPLFAPYMYNALKLGWGNSLLGFVAIGIGCPAPFMLWMYGEKLRHKSSYSKQTP